MVPSVQLSDWLDKGLAWNWPNIKRPSPLSCQHACTPGQCIPGHLQAHVRKVKRAVCIYGPCSGLGEFGGNRLCDGIVRLFTNRTIPGSVKIIREHVPGCSASQPGLVLLNPLPKEKPYGVKFAGLLAERVLKRWRELGNCKSTERGPGKLTEFNPFCS